MSMDKAIEHGKEHRKQYRGGKAIDPCCRNHGGCPACEEGRKHKYKKAIKNLDEWGQEYEVYSRSILHFNRTRRP